MKVSNTALDSRRMTVLGQKVENRRDLCVVVWNRYYGGRRPLGLVFDLDIPVDAPPKKKSLVFSILVCRDQRTNPNFSCGRKGNTSLLLSCKVQG